MEKKVEKALTGNHFAVKNRFGNALNKYPILIFPVTIGMLTLGCGAVGPPIPPEKVGIEAKASKQRQEVLEGAAETPVSEEPTEEEAVELPSFYPIGTR